MFRHYFISFNYVTSREEYSGNCEHIVIRKLKNFKDIKKIQEDISDKIKNDFGIEVESLVITGFQQTKRSLLGRLS